MKALFVIGSTREGRASDNAAEYIAERLESKGHEAELFDLRQKQFPFLNDRTYADGEKAPEPAEELSEKVTETDCLVMVTPEYNHSIPGVLKNALDHLYPEYDGKAFAYVTTSSGGFGGVRALSHLHDITLAFNARPGPDLPVSNIGDVFGENGRLLDDSYKDRIDSFIKDIEDFV